MMKKTSYGLALVALMFGCGYQEDEAAVSPAVLAELRQDINFQSTVALLQRSGQRPDFDAARFIEVPRNGIDYAIAMPLVSGSGRPSASSSLVYGHRPQQPALLEVRTEAERTANICLPEDTECGCGAFISPGGQCHGAGYQVGTCTNGTPHYQYPRYDRTYYARGIRVVRNGYLYSCGTLDPPDSDCSSTCHF